jgi:Domain of unknown function (DUF4174)
MLTAMIAALVVALAPLAMADNGPDDPLAAHRWQHRLLLVFTPSLEAAPARALQASLEEAACALADRDLRIGWLSVADGDRLADQPLSDGYAARLRSGLGVGAGDFAVFLVGKDGGIKARYDEPPALAAVFGLIDAMPMRRAELRERGADCTSF